MEYSRNVIEEELEQQLVAALNQHAMSNRGILPPFRLPAIGQTLATTLIAWLADEQNAPVHALGEELGQQGLGLPALLEAQTTALELFAAAEPGRPCAKVIGSVSHFFGCVIESFIASESASRERQRDAIEKALINTVSQQREQQEQLHSTIRELSTPIIPVYDGILILPLVGTVDTHRAHEINANVLEAIAAYQAEIVVVDITGVPVIDTSTANHLLLTARATTLLGAQMILVGIGPEIAQTIIHMGVSLENLVTLANLQAGLAYALARRGMGIQSLNGNGGRQHL